MDAGETPRSISPACLLEFPRRVADGSIPMRDWFALAITPAVVKRSLKYALIVGLLLILINHSDAILNRTVTLPRLLRMILTVLVPYTVSTLSSVGTLMDQRRAGNLGRTNHESVS